MQARFAFVLSILTVVGVVATVFAAPAQKLTIVMTDFKFTPNTAMVMAGTTVSLTLVNKGAVEHEFMLYTMPMSMGMEMDMDKYGAENTYFKGIGDIVVTSAGAPPTRSARLERVMVKPGKNVTISFVAKRKGTFEFGCHVQGHYEAGMKGTLTVK